MLKCPWVKTAKGWKSIKEKKKQKKPIGVYVRVCVSIDEKGIKINRSLLPRNSRDF